MPTFDTPVNHSAWEPVDLDLANRYSGIDLALPDGSVVPLTNAQAARHAIEEADYATDLANDVIEYLDLTDEHWRERIEEAERGAEAERVLDLSNRDPREGMWRKPANTDADLLARWDDESRR